MDDRVDGPIRAMNRAPSYEYLAKDNALRPGGGAVREPSMPSLRPGGPGALGAGAGARGSGIRCLQPLPPDMFILLWHGHNLLVESTAGSCHHVGSPSIHAPWLLHSSGVPVPVRVMMGRCRPVLSEASYFSSTQDAFPCKGACCCLCRHISAAASASSTCASD